VSALVKLRNMVAQVFEKDRVMCCSTGAVCVVHGHLQVALGLGQQVVSVVYRCGGGVGR
jgi:hypothetical protein